MDTFKEHANKDIESIYLGEEYYGTLLESGASMSRVLKKLDEGHDFVVITAFRNTDKKGNKLSIKDNRGANKALLGEFRTLAKNKKSGAYKLVGHWKECSVELPDGESISSCSLHGGTIIDAIEESWLILRHPETDRDDFKNAATTLAKKYNQDGYVARLGEVFAVFGKNGEVDFPFATKPTKKSMTTALSRVAELQGYSELSKWNKSGRTGAIIFEDWRIAVPHLTNSEFASFHYNNLLWK